MNESKQLGTLYHYTTLLGLVKILTTNTMKKAIGIDASNPNAFQGVSLTRNKNLNFENGAVRINLDGDKISNIYKIEPFNAWSNHEKIASRNNDQRRLNTMIQKREQEERVHGDLKNARSYIKSISFSTELEYKRGYDKANKTLARKNMNLDTLFSMLDDYGIEYDYENK